MRGVVLSYVISEPGQETVNTIANDLHNNDKSIERLYRVVYEAVMSLDQRGLIRFGDGPNRTNCVLWPEPNAVDVMTY